MILFKSNNFLLKLETFLQKTIKATLTVRDKEKQKQQKLTQLMQKQPDSGRTIVGFEIRYFKMKSKSYFNTI